MAKLWGKPNSSLTQEQLQALGCVGKDMSTVTTGPPVLFPFLISKPVPFEISVAQNYAILWKEDFINVMRVSPYHLHPKSSTFNNKRYSDSYLKTEKCKADLPLQLLPDELKVTGRKNTQHHKTKKMRTSDDYFKILEKKEHLEKTATKENETDSEAHAEDFEDDEMDDENDYGNNYFDNGESFNEEDDNLDDGPTY